LAKYIDCGTTQIGPNAESYDITLTLTTVLTAAENGATAMSINVEASAKPMAFSQEPFRCSTKGVLEKRVQDLTHPPASRCPPRPLRRAPSPDRAARRRARSTRAPSR